MSRSVEAAKGLYLRQKEQSPDAVPPNGSIGLAQLKDEVRYGLVPLGAIIAVATHIAGAMQPPASGVVEGGWMRADGAAIPAGNTLSGNTVDLTGSRFILGTSGAGAGANPVSGGTGGNANNEVTLTTTELPSHDHPSGSLTTTANAPHAHPGSTATVGTDIAPHNHPPNTPGTFTRNGSDFNVSISGSPTGLSTQQAGTTGTVNAPHGHPGSVSVATATAPHTHSAPSFSGLTGAEGSGNAFSILPLYVAAVYLMRVK